MASPQFRKLKKNISSRILELPINSDMIRRPTTQKKLKLFETKVLTVTWNKKPKKMYHMHAKHYQNIHIV